jgi:lipopolysaccharide transport system ATP-binding protein
MSVAIRVENLGKMYRLGVINRQMLYQEIQSRWARFRGKEDPHAPIHPEGHRHLEGDILWALQDISFEVKEGDVVGIIGANGAGKSTLLKILSKITAPTEGHVYLKGQVASLLEVGTGFHSELTGRENVYLNGTILGMTKRDVDRRYDEIVAFSGVEQFLDTPVKRYSSGMKVRLAFAVAAHLEPEILIIDEVLAVGDAAFRQKCVGKLSDVASEGRTVLFVSHNMVAVENLCERGIVLADGRVKYDGTQVGAIAQYLDQLAAHPESLANRTDRHGTGAIRIMNIEVRNSDGKKLGSVSAGQDVEFCFHFEKRPGASFQGLACRFILKTQFDVAVFCQNNFLSGDMFDDLPDTGTFVCRIPRLPLPEGTYRMDYDLAPKRPRGTTFDRLERAFQIDVIGGDFFGTGKVPKVRDGVCLVEGRWRLEGNSPARGDNLAEEKMVTGSEKA